MKKVIATLTIATFFVAFAFAGDPVAKNIVVEDPACFTSGLEFNAYAAAMLPDGGDSELGGGVGLAYYFTKNIGVDFNYAVFAYDSEVHNISTDLALRYPIANSCLAPYLLVGGGLRTNGTTDGLWRLGGGLDLRLQGKVGVFADGVYHWVEGDTNFTIARLGVRIPF